MVEFFKSRIRAILTLSFMMALTASVHAQVRFTFNDLNYEVIDEQAATCRFVGKNYSPNDYITYLEIPAEAINYDGGKRYVVTEIGNNVHSTGLLGVTDVTLPSTIISINEWAFSSLDKLTRINLPNQLEAIGSFAFEGCTSLESISLPGSLKSIGEEAFRGCTKIQNITLPNGIETIGDWAFRGIMLDEVTIPNSVTHLGRYLFDYVYFHDVEHGGVNKLIIADGSKAIECVAETFHGVKNLHIGRPWSYYNDNYLTNTTTQHVTVGDNVTAVIDHAFQNFTNLESVTLPSSLQSIGERAFWHTAINEFTIPASVKELGNDPFCHSGEGVAIKKLTIADSDSPLLCYSNDFFREFENVYIGRNWSYQNERSEHWKYVTSVTLGNKVTELPNNAFAHFGNIESIELPNTITAIGSNAFLYCYSLKTIDLPNTVKTIGAAAFGGTGIEKIIIPSSVTHVAGKNLCTRYDPETDTLMPVGEMIIADGDEPIVFESGDIFASVDNLYLGRDWSYANYGNLKRIVKSVSIGTKVRDICENAFSNFYELKSVTIPNSVTSVGNFAFAYCTALESVDLPESLEIIPNQCFRGCTSLKSIALPESTTHISDGAFYDCNNIESVSIPEKVKIIDAGSFRKCSLLKSLIIPASVDSIGRRAFADNPLLKELRFEEGNTPVAFNVTAFEKSPVATLTLSRDLDLRPDTPEHGIYNSCLPDLESIEFGDNIKRIPAYFCFLNKNITHIELPQNVEIIGKAAFYHCPINTLTIPDSVKEIGDGAFEECGIKNIKMSENIEKIGERAFSWNDFTEIQLPNTLIEAGWEAFSQCPLTHLEIPKSLTCLESEVFNTLEPLKSVEIPTNIESIDQYAVKAEKIIITDSDKPLYSENDEPFHSVNQIYLGRDLIMPNPVGLLDESAKDIRKVTIGNLVTEIVENLFSSSHILSKCEFGSGLKKIAKGAFKNCSLREVVIPSSVGSIGEGAFMLNSDLETITIGSGIATLEEDAFGDDYDIETIYITALTPPAVSDNTFASYKATVYVDPAAMEDYKNASSCWKKFTYEPMIVAERLEVTKEETRADAENGDQIQYVASVFPDNATLKQVFWESSNPEIATVDGNGLVTKIPGRSGNVKITARTLYANGPVVTVDLGVENGISEIILGEANRGIHDNNVYTMQGICVLRSATEESMKTLLPGIYIMNGQKLVIR